MANFQRGVVTLALPEAACSRAASARLPPVLLRPASAATVTTVAATAAPAARRDLRGIRALRRDVCTLTTCSALLVRIPSGIALDLRTPVTQHISAVRTSPGVLAPC